MWPTAITEEGKGAHTAHRVLFTVGDIKIARDKKRARQEIAGVLKHLDIKNQTFFVSTSKYEQSTVHFSFFSPIPPFFVTF